MLEIVTLKDGDMYSLRYPNDTEGQEFVDTCKKYLNRESYTLRVIRTTHQG